MAWSRSAPRKSAALPTSASPFWALPTAAIPFATSCGTLKGRYAGWIALYSGLSGSADVILLPEIPFDIEKVCAKIRSREAAGRRFSIVVVAEGARSKHGTVELVERRGVGTADRLGGIGSKVARAIEHFTGKETRTLVLGHLQRGGSPTTYDRLLALRFGAAAGWAIAERCFGG